ncbi:MAG: glycoside hydrolase family 88 protein [Prevotellaceae bacterium]|jgi:rhamnogalacturonyl hydrolase YesR|nr:glycoside hydrolase family 88 protein [Prevotellaceae bacterium]
MKKISCLLLIACVALRAGAQKTDEQALRSIADNILRQPVTEFVGVKDGKTYLNTKDIPKGEDVKFKSPLGEWHYSNGVLDRAMVHLGQHLGEQKYVDYAVKHVKFGFDNYEYFRATFRNDRKHHTWCFGQLWTMKELDDFGAMGAAVIDVYELTGKSNAAYKKYFEDGSVRITSGQERLPDGTLCRTFPKQMTVWADDAYMGVSFLARLAHITGNRKYLDDAATQIINIAGYLWDESKQLYYHCYYSDLKRNGVAYWGRANGWITLATCELLSVMPDDHPQKSTLKSLLERQIVGFARYQDGQGFWRQLLDKSDSYQESSVTALFTYGVARAVNEGWIPDSYRSIALNGWRAMKASKITDDGHFKDVCVGTGIADDLPFYYNRPVGENEKHGLGLIIECGVEIMKMSQKKP